VATPHHWPPELSKLVAQAVARLNKGKRNVLAFFAACSVPDEYLDPWRQRLNNDQTSVSKLGMAENIVMRINEKPEANQFIKVRREVIRRIVETNSYDQCWPDDQAVARGLVASIRELVEERDFFSKTIEATERLQEERRRHRAKELDVELTRKGEREQLRKRFYQIFSMEAEPQKRGYAFQKFLNDLFALERIQIREAFSVGSSEQIDGAINLDSHIYLIEARWWAHPLSHKDVSDLYIKVSGRPLQTRGLFISGSGFTDECVEVCRQSKASQIIFMTCEDLVDAFENALSVAELIRKKAEYAMTEGKILVSAREILERLR